MKDYRSVSNNRDKIIGIIADVTGCSTKKIWGGTKIEKIFTPLGVDDVWLYLDFCERLEQAFSIKFSNDEQLEILDSTLLGLEVRIAKKIASKGP